ncbi:ribosome assembly RNA-binding protein YhbY [Denitromonas iodatirespirans]|uniref:Ribosome assembly RNA-binding protein YhbY n=1 Tax=Denitromonas iodatirespirans TaxID=2795389 RepID=A0A944H7W7_DENI1|nr:ribosome assembly RNA-binding protein YhbY [Denitromonas iodatirespirans]MBT0960745.1 ribosome assembly RNA-binding protein YhbY [Denitromonas iodatirespirans]
MTDLTPAQRRELRARAHHLNPVVSVAGNGLSPSVLAEIDQNLKAHELIKVRVYGEDRDARSQLMADICEQTGAASVQHIGNILVLWREAPVEDKPVAEVKPKPARPAADKPKARAPYSRTTTNSRAKPAARGTARRTSRG